jgi:tetratricopeptide (TPR) repeat protein
VEEAIACFDRALEVAPDNAGAHANLGKALIAARSFEAAIEHLERARELDPGSGFVHNNLGLARRSLGEPDRAVQAFTAAIEIDPSYGPAYINLGSLQRARGRNREALEAFEGAVESFDTGDTSLWSLEFAQQWGQYARDQIGQIRRAPALEEVLAGRRRAASSTEWAEAVNHAYAGRRFAEIVALTETTLASAPDLIGDEGWHAYNSACAAVLLADDAEMEPNAAERTRVRDLARSWLAAELERWRAWVATGEREADARSRVQRALQDPDFASVRGDALEGLSTEEQLAWGALWRDLERVLE